MRKKRHIAVDPIIAHKVLLLLLDVISIVAALWCSIVLSAKYYEDRFDSSRISVPEIVLLMIFYIPVMFLYFRNRNLYKELGFSRSDEHFKVLLQAWIVGAMLFLTFAFLLRLFPFNDFRLPLVAFAALTFAFLTLGRFLFVPWLTDLLLPRVFLKNNLVIVGAGSTGITLASYLYDFKRTTNNLVGFVDDNPEEAAARSNGTPILGTIADLPRIVKKHRIREIFVCIPSLRPPQLSTMFDILRPLPVRVRIAANPFRTIVERAPQTMRLENNFVTLNDSKLLWVDTILKRLFDLFGAIAGLLFISPIFLLIGAAIKLDSRGPIFFKQKRVGKEGRSFKVLKFRSMIENTELYHQKAVRNLMESSSGGIDDCDKKKNRFKLADDSKMTRVGRLLRRTSLDELPQIVNVLSGDMSLVGPRPEPTYQVELYKPWHRARLTVKPGMTGFWQVYGRSSVTFDEMVLMDIFYIENWSFALDLKILFRTPFVMITGKGAV